VLIIGAGNHDGIGAFALNIIAAIDTKNGNINNFILFRKIGSFIADAIAA
jgi:hypothetical protein